MKKMIRKPENWQDFESLCKMLWGEIWGCREIKKNGRNGQNQNGVDIYGIPEGESEYYGIQCKGKGDYTHKKLSLKEIDQEIQRATYFKPSLKKLYFATTANKDTNIEEYIRVKDKENRDRGLFEIHLFSWEDIADLIENNKATFDWYVKNINHKVKYDVEVTFHNKEKVIAFEPKLLKNYVVYKTEPIDYSSLRMGYPPFDRDEKKREIETEPQPRRFFLNGMRENKSSCVFAIRIENIGNETIKNFKLYFILRSDKILIDRVSKEIKFLDDHEYSYNIRVNKESKEGLFEPKQTILVQKDRIFSDEICIRPIIESKQEFILSWKLVSEDFSDEGDLAISINPEIHEMHTVEKIDQFSSLTDEVRLDNYSS